MRRTLVFALSLLLAAAACGPTEVVVTIEIEVPNPDGEGMVTRALSDVEVQLIPFDRDAVFDSMTTAYGSPEPEVPQELVTRRGEVQEAQQEWDEANRGWATIRDTLQKLNDAMEQYSRGEATYVALFREWQDWESRLGTAEREVERTFDIFDSLQQGTIRESDSVRILQENWADDAFADIGTVFADKQRATGLDWVVDTTDANGLARGNLMVKPGTYWVHARYELPYTELYWNEMIEVVGGEPMTVTLTRANAQERIKL
ncbi:MAG: hypothetical protein OEN56_00510 [Gemmatimonadota bacterium]|nr:hypothetical protein [Gemmatimonadota bacterium]MDH3424161.1 hypothetical protein [Gemmatimonadota bacterium]